MNKPAKADIQAAYEHGVWLRGQECTGEGRMLADLSVWADQLRSALTVIAAQAELTARTFPNAPGVGDWRTIAVVARNAIAKATHP